MTEPRGYKLLPVRNCIEKKTGIDDINPRFSSKYKKTMELKSQITERFSEKALKCLGYHGNSTETYKTGSTLFD